MVFGTLKYNRRSGTVLVLLIAAMVIELIFMDQWGKRHEQRQDVLRVASPVHEWIQSGLSPYGPGFERELLDRFAETAGVTWKWQQTGSWRQAWELLAEGRADMVPGLGAAPPRRLRANLAGGEPYAEFKPLIVRSSKRYGLRRPEEICDTGVLLPDNPALMRALYRQTEPMEGCSPLPVIHTKYEQEPILKTLQKDRARFALVDSGRFMLWQPFYEQVRPTKELERSLRYRWFWNRESGLSGKLRAFWKKSADSEWFAELYERYFGFLPEETDYYQLTHLARTVERKLDVYRSRIAAAAFKNKLDPLLLTAIIYQESHFDPHAKSRTGVRGLMQITRVTAKELGIDRNDPEQSISGGAAYLKGLYDRLEPFELPRWDRWFFAMAAYNQGWGHLRDAMRLSEKLGGTGRTWRELKKVYPLLARSKYYKDAKHGYARGWEAVDYVDSIRYYYYVLNGLIVLSRPESEHLPALVPSVALAGF
jgi:membrane-bound lytic murein transglycosylase F